MRSGTGDDAYLGLLRRGLDAAFEECQPDIILYNAGTDILAGDPLGLCVPELAPALVAYGRYCCRSLPNTYIFGRLHGLQDCMMLSRQGRMAWAPAHKGSAHCLPSYVQA